MPWVRVGSGASCLRLFKRSMSCFKKDGVLRYKRKHFVHKTYERSNTTLLLRSSCGCSGLLMEKHASLTVGALSMLLKHWTPLDNRVLDKNIPVATALHESSDRDSAKLALLLLIVTEHRRNLERT